MSLDTSIYDTYDCMLDDIPFPLYFYFMDKDNYRHRDNNLDVDNTQILGQCPSIISVLWTPFIERDNLSLVDIPYDVKRFGTTDGLKPSLTNQPHVQRIKKTHGFLTILDKFKCYEPTGRTIGGVRNWRNESRLYNYPYMFATINDNINQPLEILYHLCLNNENDICVKYSLSDRCNYVIKVSHYKGDGGGTREGLISSNSLEIPCSSSAYANYMATSKAQTNFGTYTTNLIGFGSNLASARGGASLLNVAKDGILGLANSIGAKMAMEEDLRTTPRALTNRGTDVPLFKMNSVNNMHLVRYKAIDEDMERIGTYFAMFGYKQNKLMKPNIRNRYYYNYIEMENCNIKGSNIPREHFQEIKNIFLKGTTVWHIDRTGVIVGDYSRDNYEV